MPGRICDTVQTTSNPTLWVRCKKGLMSLFSREITAVCSTSQQLVTDISVENKTTQPQQVLALVTPKPNTEEMASSTRGSPSVDHQVQLILEGHDKEETISESGYGYGYGSVTQEKESKPVASQFQQEEVEKEWLEFEAMSRKFMDSRLKDKTENKQAPLSQENPRRKTPSRLEAFLSAKARKISKAPRQLKKFLAQANKRRKINLIKTLLERTGAIKSLTIELERAIKRFNRNGDESEINAVKTKIEAKKARNAEKIKKYQTGRGEAKARIGQALLKKDKKYKALLKKADDAINTDYQRGKEAIKNNLASLLNFIKTPGCLTTS